MYVRRCWCIISRMNERFNTVLKWTIWIYGFLCVASIFAEAFNQVGGLWNVVAHLTFLDCGWRGIGNFCRPIYFEGMSFILLIIIGVIRYIIFGKTYQK